MRVQLLGLVDANEVGGEHWTYEYDLNGNRTKAGTATYSYNAVDQLLEVDGQPAGTTYDNRGNQTTRTPDGRTVATTTTGAGDTGYLVADTQQSIITTMNPEGKPGRTFAYDPYG